MADDIVDFSFDEVVAQMDEDDGFGVMADDSAAENARGAGEPPRENAVSADEENHEPADEEPAEVIVAEKSEPASDGFVDDSRAEAEFAPVHGEEEPSPSVPETSAAVVPAQEDDAVSAEENPEEISGETPPDDEGGAAGSADVTAMDDENRAIEEAGAAFNPLDPESVGNFLEKMGVSPDLIESKKCLVDVMQRENDLLDEILRTQAELHDFVRQKNWDSLNEKLESLQNLSDSFSELEEERETLCELIDMRSDEELSPVLTQVRGKLQKSKIENHALNEYITTTRKFLQGVFDSVVPQRRNVLYSKTGKIVRPEISGVSLDISL